MPLHGLGHALVLTDDLEATRAFYCDVLGLEPGDRPSLPFPGYWLYLDGVACMHVAERAAYDAEVDRMGLPRAQGPVDHLAFDAADHEAIVAPYLMSGGTDAKHFRKLGMRSYGFAPLRLPADLDFTALFHGVDERVPTDALEFGARVFDRFLDQA